MENIRKLVLVGEEAKVNSYIIEHNKKCYIVDPGFQKESIIEYVEANELQPEGILLTHAHLDHIGAVDVFNVPVYLHEKEYPVFLDDNLNCFAFHDTPKLYDESSINIKILKDGDKLPLEDEQIEVIHTPGHTVGGVCYKYGDDLYTGDTLFSGTVGKWIFPTGNNDEMKQTIINLIESLPEETKVHPGHGRSSTIGIEKKENKFYLEWKSQK